MVKRIIAILVCLTIACTLLSAICFADSTTIATLAELQTAIDDPSIDTIYLTETMTLPNGTVLDGKNKTIRVQIPYLDECGAVRQSTASYSGIFTIAADATVSLSNMTLMSGAQAAIVNRGLLTMENVIVTQSNRALQATQALTIMKNCSIVRNAANYGGGIVCSGGKLLMDGCSLSENRSLLQGGGAIEVNSSAEFYMNNTVVANNTSKEIGGAVNNYTSKVYIMNSTICGNITTVSVTNGGGIGNNSSHGVFAVNSIIADNYAIPLGTESPARSDIYYSNNPIHLTNCIVAAVAEQATLISCAYPDQPFASYRNDGILYDNDKISTAFARSALVSKSNNGVSLYAPLANQDTNATGAGIATYFDYDRTLSNVRMSYGEGGATALGDLSVATTHVTTYYEGGTRADGVIGASGIGTATATVYLVDNDATKGSVDGASIFGNSYPAGTTITVNAYPVDGYIVDSWTIRGDVDTNTLHFYGSSCSFRINSNDLFVTPSWTEARNSLYFSEQPESLTTVLQGEITGELRARARALIDAETPAYNWYECSADGVITVPSLGNNDTFPIPTDLVANAQSKYYLCQVTLSGAPALDSDIAEVVVTSPAPPPVPETSDNALPIALLLAAMLVSAGMIVILKKKREN